MLALIIYNLLIQLHYSASNPTKFLFLKQLVTNLCLSFCYSSSAISLQKSCCILYKYWTVSCCSGLQLSNASFINTIICTNARGLSFFGRLRCSDRTLISASSCSLSLNKSGRSEISSSSKCMKYATQNRRRPPLFIYYRTTKITIYDLCGWNSTSSN